MSVDSTRADFDARSDTIEQAYEFFLAFASQGHPADEQSAGGREVREYLARCDAALNQLSAASSVLVAHTGSDPAPYRAFLDVIARDAQDASAAIQVVLAQPAISSQLVDNLNASIHLRALLTDLFLIDEALKLRR